MKVKLGSLKRSDIINVASWFENNKLTLNVEKTCTMFVGNQSVMPKLFLYHQELDNKAEVKYLGLTIDQNLTWSQHIYEMCNKLRPKVGLLSRIRHYLPFQQTNDGLLSPDSIHNRLWL